ESVPGSTGADGVWATTFAEVADEPPTSWDNDAVAALVSGATPSSPGEAQPTTKKTTEIAHRLSTTARQLAW
ncbi:MAG: hypothetical protein VX685_04530, partial [Actinomycetota bacterium]|nr:hypothetical protein [Actinomycetota bacterium]